jgi:hypothetical protein
VFIGLLLCYRFDGTGENETETVSGLLELTYTVKKGNDEMIAVRFNP